MATRFKISTDSGEPITLVELDTKWSTFLPERDRDSLARWGRDAKPGNTRQVGKITITCVEAKDILPFPEEEEPLGDVGWLEFSFCIRAPLDDWPVEKMSALESEVRSAIIGAEKWLHDQLKRIDDQLELVRQ